EMKLNCSYTDIKGEKVAQYLVDKVHIAFDNAHSLNMSKEIYTNILNNTYTNIHYHIKNIFNTEKL
ncbi:hypothetical protein, partial [Enterococcus faecium]|uniref:hypothetical protein n=1 Tax=Enterococcus faecium TaxID=1352 RepID=UPI0039FDB1FC